MNIIDPHLKIVVGLGKTGISCIRYLCQQGCQVAVVDNRTTPPGLEELHQKFPEIPVYLGDFNVEVLTQANELIISPGISLHEPAITECLRRGIKVVGDVALFAQAAQAPIVAITGSNGKSTVTYLVGMMAEAAGRKIKVGGNIGIPMLDLLDSNTDLYVLELSSFQLETIYAFKPKVAVVLNVSPDHMDRYRDFNEYVSIKQRIYSDCQTAIINRDDYLSHENVALPQKIISFGMDAPQKNNFGIVAGYLAYGNKKLLPIEDLKIKGLHNVANALAALALGTAINLPLAAMLQTLRNFSGLPHRCQWVATINNVAWYNDSKATNVGATKAAIGGLGARMNGKIVLLAGGIGKDANFAELRDVIAKYVHTVVLFGRDALLIQKALIGKSKIFRAESISDAIAICIDVARPGDKVLFSPACASFDMFNNFEHRGTVFMEELRKFSTPVAD